MSEIVSGIADFGASLLPGIIWDFVLTWLLYPIVEIFYVGGASYIVGETLLATYPIPLKDTIIGLGETVGSVFLGASDVVTGVLLPTLGALITLLANPLTFFQALNALLGLVLQLVAPTVARDDLLIEDASVIERIKAEIENKQ